MNDCDTKHLIEAWLCKFSLFYHHLIIKVADSKQTNVIWKQMFKIINLKQQAALKVTMCIIPSMSGQSLPGVERDSQEW